MTSVSACDISFILKPTQQVGVRSGKMRSERASNSESSDDMPRALPAESIEH